jgi:hypothetical protein
MKTPIEVFREHFNDVIEEVQRFAVFVRGIEFQFESISKLEALEQESLTAKLAAVDRQSEDEANAYLAFETMAKALSEEFRFYIKLKNDLPDEAWDHLINAQSCAATAMKAHGVASHLDGYIQRLHTLERLFFPTPVFFSSGFIVRNSECSICHSEYGECSHLKGRPYMGQICTRIVTDAELLEVSVVSDPADKHCRALHYTEDGVPRNVFTQRVMEDKEAQQDAS